MSVSRMYANALVSRAATKIQIVFLGEKRKPSTECETDSKPTNAHGVSTTMRMICMIGLVSVGAKLGENVKDCCPCTFMTATKATMMPPSRMMARRICSPMASRLPFMQMRLTTTTAVMVSRISPMYTS